MWTTSKIIEKNSEAKDNILVKMGLDKCYNGRLADAPAGQFYGSGFGKPVNSPQRGKSGDKLNKLEEIEFYFFSLCFYFFLRLKQLRRNSKKIFNVNNAAWNLDTLCGFWNVDVRGSHLGPIRDVGTIKTAMILDY